MFLNGKLPFLMILPDGGKNVQSACCGLGWTGMGIGVLALDQRVNSFDPKGTHICIHLICKWTAISIMMIAQEIMMMIKMSSIVMKIMVQLTKITIKGLLNIGRHAGNSFEDANAIGNRILMWMEHNSNNDLD